MQIKFIEGIINLFMSYIWSLKEIVKIRSKIEIKKYIL